MVEPINNGNNPNTQPNEQEERVSPIELAADKDEPATTTRPQNDMEPDGPAVMAGLSAGQIGASALSMDAIREQEALLKSAPNPQDLRNDAEQEGGPYAGRDNKNTIYNLAMGGAAGNFAGTIYAELAEEQLRYKKQEEENDKLRYMLAAADTLDDLFDFAKDLNEESKRLKDRIEDQTNDTSQVMYELGMRRNEIYTALTEEQKKLKELEDRAANGDTSEELKQQIAEQKLRVENLDSQQNAIAATMEQIGGRLAKTLNAQESAQRDINGLQKRIDDARASGNESEVESLKKELESARLKLKEADDQLKTLENQTKLAKELLSSSFIAGQNKDLSPAQIKDQTAIINIFVKSFNDDGIISANEGKELANLFKNSNLPPSDIQAFAKSVAGAGIGFEIINPDGSSSIVKGDAAEQLIIQGYQKLLEEKKQTTNTLDATILSKAEIEASLKAEMAKLSGLQNTLKAAEATLAKETAETATVSAGASSAVAGMQKYASMQAYMSDNFHIYTAGNQNGKDIFAVANDPNGLLKDSKGNLVYMDKESMAMYTLQKNPDGSVARDANGQQVKVAVSKEESVALQSKMVENKLVPRNFVPDGDGVFGFKVIDVAYKEYSEHDTFRDTFASSTTGGMKTDLWNQNIQAAVEAQKNDQATAQAQKAQAANDVQATTATINSTKSDITQTQSRIEALQAKLNEINAKIATTEHQAEKQGIVLPGKEATTNATAANTTATAQGTTDTSKATSASETLALNTPSYSLEDAAARLREIKDALQELAQSGKGLSQDDYNKLLESGAEFGISRDTIDYAMKQNKVSVDNGLAPNSPNQTIATLSQEQPSQNLKPDTPTVFGGLGLKQDIQVTTPANAPAEIRLSGPLNPSQDYVSFADGPGFTAYNGPSANDASYNQPATYTMGNVIDASDKFSSAGSTAPKQPEIPSVGGMTPEQIALQNQLAMERLRTAQMSTGTIGGGASA